MLLSLYASFRHRQVPVSASDALPDEGRHRAEIASKVDAIVNQRIARDADLDERAGRNAMHRPRQVADVVATSALYLAPSRWAECPDALPRAGGGRAGADRRPDKMHCCLDSGRRTRSKRPLTVERIGWPELRALRGDTAGDSSSDRMRAPVH